MWRFVEEKKRPVSWFFLGLPKLERAITLSLCASYTMATFRRSSHLWGLCRSLNENRIEGDFAECGVWRGGSAAIMASSMKSSPVRRNLHLFDSFEGLPEPTQKDGEAARGYSGGRNEGNLRPVNQCVAEISVVKKLFFGRFKIPAEQVKFHKGWFQDTIPKAVHDISKIALLRLDGDWYESTKVCLEHLYPKVILGGAVILDDYFAWEGCKNATEEYRAKNQISEKVLRIDKDAAFWIKS